jgi:hypothetical protein
MEDRVALSSSSEDAGGLSFLFLDVKINEMERK